MLYSYGTESSNVNVISLTFNEKIEQNGNCGISKTVNYFHWLKNSF